MHIGNHLKRAGAFVLHGWGQPYVWSRPSSFILDGLLLAGCGLLLWGYAPVVDILALVCSAAGLACFVLVGFAICQSCRNDPVDWLNAAVWMLGMGLSCSHLLPVYVLPIAWGCKAASRVLYPTYLAWRGASDREAQSTTPSAPPEEGETGDEDGQQPTPSAPFEDEDSGYSASDEDSSSISYGSDLS